MPRPKYIYIVTEPLRTLETFVHKLVILTYAVNATFPNVLFVFNLFIPAVTRTQDQCKICSVLTLKTSAGHH